MALDSPSTPTVFISFARGDESTEDASGRWHDRLLQHLGGIVRQQDIEIWSDHQIKLGDDWHRAIQDKLESARVAILLVGPAFLASEYAGFVNGVVIPVDGGIEAMLAVPA